MPGGDGAPPCPEPGRSLGMQRCSALQDLLPNPHHGGVAPAPGLGSLGAIPQGGCSNLLSMGNVPPKPTRDRGPGPYPDLDLRILDVDIPDCHNNIAGLVLGEESHHLDEVVLGQALPILLVQDAQGHAILWKEKQSRVRPPPQPSGSLLAPSCCWDGLGSPGASPGALRGWESLRGAGSPAALGVPLWGMGTMGWAWHREPTNKPVLGGVSPNCFPKKTGYS